MGTEIQKKTTVSSLLASNAVKSLGETLHLNQKQLIKANGVAIQLASNSTLSQCTPASIIQYCYSIARYDFSRDDSVYPVPYGNKVQAQIGYQGWKELAMRTGKYSKIDCVEVKECDEIITDEDGEPDVKFEKDYIKRMNSKRIGFFGYAKDKSNKYVKRIFWTDEMAMKHGKRYSKTFNSLWGKAEDFPKMAKKTIIKFVCKDLDLSEDLQNALKDDQAIYQNNITGDKVNYTYEDNPKNAEVFDFSSQDEEPKKTTVKNNLAKPQAPTTPAVEEKPKTVPTKSQELPEEDAFDVIDEITGA